MLSSYSWLRPLDLDFSCQGQFYMSRHVTTETRAADPSSGGEQLESWRVVHVVADATAMDVKVGHHTVYSPATTAH